MEVYLPIAQTAVNWAVISGMGLAVGVLSGMLGVSGGFIMTPLLIFSNIPPGVAVATQASPIAAASMVGALTQRGRGGVDFRMGFALLIGGLMGASLGVYLFSLLQASGQLDFVVEVSYVILLGSVGGLMLKESFASIRATRTGKPGAAYVPGRHIWIHNLPFKMRFRRSGLYISVIPVIVLGFLVGVMTAILGTGGAFILIPAKIYILRMRTNIAVGTSQFQMFVVAVMTTLLHAMTDHTVDIVLGFLLVVGSIMGAQIGIRLAAKLRSEELRAILALLVVGIALRLMFDLVATPMDIYTIAPGIAGSSNVSGE